MPGRKKAMPESLDANAQRARRTQILELICFTLTAFQMQRVVRTADFSKSFFLSNLDREFEIC